MMPTAPNPDQLRAGLLNKSIEISIVPSYVAANLRAQGQPVLLHNIMTRRTAGQSHRTPGGRGDPAND